MKYDNKYNQLGVGTLLREMGTTDKEGVTGFIREHYDSLSRQGLRYAIERMPERERQQILKMRPRRP